MSEFVKEITETIKYLSERSGREHYTKIFPEGVELYSAGEILKKLEEEKRYRKDIGFWLWRLLEGYRKFYAPMVWQELFRSDYHLFEKILGLFFSSIRGWKFIYKVLTENPQRLHPDELIWISRYIIKHKDKALRCDKAEPSVAKLFYSLELPNSDTDGTNTIIAVRKFAFDPLVILLHAYLYYVLSVVAPLEASKKSRKRCKKV
jgi:hypothetical protein